MIREAVSGIFTFGKEVFITHRQNYLRAFPGYHAFPGGKVDKEDSLEGNQDEQKLFSEDVLLKKFPLRFMRALNREMKEELGIDILKLIKNNLVNDIHEIGIGITPAFNPYRYDTHFYIIDLAEKVSFDVAKDEAQDAYWSTPSEILENYKKAQVMAVPPIIVILEALSSDIKRRDYVELSLDYDPELEIPMIESVYGIKQFIPLSNTIPPANRTNSFLIGDKGEAFLIDPSPKNKGEKEKFLKSLENHEVNGVFLTHHHKDHHEFAPDFALHFGVPLLCSKDTYQRIRKNWGENYFKGIEVKVVGEGDLLTHSLGKKVNLYHVPGHDEGQLALANESLDWFIAGDLIQGIGTVVVGGPEGNMKKYMNSLDRVIKLGPRFIFPSHGIGLGGTFKIEETLKHRFMRENQIRGFLKEGKTKEEILKLIYHDISPHLLPLAMKNIHSHLEKIEEDENE